MNYRLYLTLIITIIFSACTRTETAYNQSINKKFTLDYLHQLPNDTIRYSFENNLNFNKNLDSLLDTPIYMFTLKDTLHNSVLMNWYSFMGSMNIQKINNEKYEFLGKSNLPVNGNWEISFKQHLMFRYILEIGKNSYQLYRDKSIQPKLPYDENRILTLEKSILNDTICTNKDWEIAFQCFPKIHEYEYHLFAALLDNKMEYASTYVTLRDSIDVVGAGELSQYYSGNIMTLIDLGILDVAFDKDRLRGIEYR